MACDVPAPTANICCLFKPNTGLLMDITSRKKILKRLHLLNTFTLSFTSHFTADFCKLFDLFNRLSWCCFLHWEVIFCPGLTCMSARLFSLRMKWNSQWSVWKFTFGDKIQSNRKLRGWAESDSEITVTFLSFIKWIVKKNNVLIITYNQWCDGTQLYIQGAAKKMTQHVKCDYLVTPENFCAKFGRIV